MKPTASAVADRLLRLSNERDALKDGPKAAYLRACNSVKCVVADILARPTDDFDEVLLKLATASEGDDADIAWSLIRDLLPADEGRPVQAAVKLIGASTQVVPDPALETVRRYRAAEQRLEDTPLALEPDDDGPATLAYLAEVRAIAAGLPAAITRDGACEVLRFALELGGFCDSMTEPLLRSVLGYLDSPAAQPVAGSSRKAA